MQIYSPMDHFPKHQESVFIFMEAGTLCLKVFINKIPFKRQNRAYREACAQDHFCPRKPYLNLYILGACNPEERIGCRYSSCELLVKVGIINGKCDAWKEIEIDKMSIMIVGS